MIRHLALLGLVALACSTQNREGPDVSCGDLDNGGINACQQGIIATCSSGSVKYQVCDDDSACDAAWQDKGKFRCQQADPVPGLDGGSSGSGGMGGSGGTSGSGGSGGSGGTAGFNPGSGGSGGTGGTSGSGGCGSRPCVIATSSPPGGIVDLVADSTNVYFATDCGNVWKVPKTGGPTVPVANTGQSAGSCLNGGYGGHLAVTGTDVFYSPWSSAVRKVPLAGGGPTDIVTDGVNVGFMASSADQVVWTEQGRITRFDLASAVTDRLPAADIGSARIAIDNGTIYWAGYTNAAIYSLPVVANPGDAPSSIPLAGVNRVSDLVVDTGTAFFADETGGLVGSVDLSSAVATTLVSGIASPQAIVADDANVYWTDADSIHKVARTGGQPTLFASRTGISIAPMLIDQTRVYWVENGYQVVSAPK